MGPTRASSSATSSGRTSTTCRPVDSANRAVAKSPAGSRRSPRRAGRRCRARRGRPPAHLRSRRGTPGPSRPGSPRGGRGSAAARRGPVAGGPGTSGAPSTRSRWLPANSGAVRPSSSNTLPGAVSSAVTVRPTSGTWATAVITSVGGTAWRRPSAPTYSLFSESLPDTNGAPWAIAASWQPRTAATSSPSVLGRRGSPHEKLSSRATRSGSAPTATTLRIASSTAAWAMASGSCRPYQGLTPMPTAMPWVSRGSASTTPSPGPSPSTPTSGRTAVPPPISWS